MSVRFKQKATRKVERNVFFRLIEFKPGGGDESGGGGDNGGGGGGGGGTMLGGISAAFTFPMILLESS